MHIYKQNNITYIHEVRSGLCDRLSTQTPARSKHSLQVSSIVPQIQVRQLLSFFMFVCFFLSLAEKAEYTRYLNGLSSILTMLLKSQACTTLFKYFLLQDRIGE